MEDTDQAKGKVINGKNDPSSVVESLFEVYRETTRSVLRVKETTCLTEEEEKSTTFHIIEYECPTLNEIPILPRNNIPRRKLDLRDNFRFMITSHELGELYQFMSEDEKKLRENDTVVYIFGTTGGDECAPITVMIHGYHPYFRLSIPDELDPESFRKNVLTSVYTNLGPQHGLHDCKVVSGYPSTGYRNTKMNFLHIEGKTEQCLHNLKRYLLTMFPKPTREDIENGRYAERNNTVICEDGEEPVKFLTEYGIMSAGWVELKGGSYTVLDDSFHQTIYGFSVHAKDIISLRQLEEVASLNTDSCDIEVIRHADDGNMPNPFLREDMISHVGHSFLDHKQRFKPLNIIFTWGDKFHDFAKSGFSIWSKNMKLYKPEQDDEKVTIYIMRFRNELEMLEKWAIWRSSKYMQTDIETGYNVFGFDYWYILKRMLNVYKTQLHERAFLWSKLTFFQVKLKTSKISSTAIAFKKFYEFVSPGRVCVDAFFLVDRDINIKGLPSKGLKDVGAYRNAGNKLDVYAGDMKRYFYGTLIQRGIMTIYNHFDERISMKIFLYYISKVIQVARINGIRMMDYCTRGQQQRVWSVYLYMARQDGFILYRPYYHPVLDGVIFEKESDAKLYYSKQQRLDNEKHHNQTAEVKEEYQTFDDETSPIPPQNEDGDTVIMTGQTRNNRKTVVNGDTGMEETIFNEEEDFDAEIESIISAIEYMGHLTNSSMEISEPDSKRIKTENGHQTVVKQQQTPVPFIGMTNRHEFNEGDPFQSVYNKTMDVKTDEEATAKIEHMKNVDLWGFHGDHHFERRAHVGDEEDPLRYMPKEEIEKSQNIVSRHLKGRESVENMTLAGSNMTIGQKREEFNNRQNEKRRRNAISRNNQPPVFAPIFGNNIGQNSEGSSSRYTYNGKSLEYFKSLSNSNGGPNSGAYASKKGGKKNTGESKSSVEGAYIMIPVKGLFYTCVFLDWNALYPNILISWYLDPSNIVLDKRYANNPDLTYNHIRFNRWLAYAFVKRVGPYMKMSIYMVKKRKATQGVAGLYEKRGKIETSVLVDLVKRDCDGKTFDKETDLISFADRLMRKSTASIVEQSEADGKDKLKTLQKLNAEALRWNIQRRIIDNISILDQLLKDSDGLAISPKDLNTPPINKTLDYATLFQKDGDAWWDEIYKPFMTRFYEGSLPGAVSGEKIKNICAEVTSMLSQYKRTFGEELMYADLKQITKEIYMERTPNIVENPRVIKDILETKECYTDLFNEYDAKQNEEKSTANSGYGFALSGGPFTFDDMGFIMHRSKHQIIPIGACITFLGRYCINICKDYVEKTRKIRVIYADTDSLILHFGFPNTQESFKKAFAIAKEIANHLTGIFKIDKFSTMKMEVEKAGNMIMFGVSKCYGLAKIVDKAGAMFELVIKGLTIIKTDTPKFVSRLGIGLIEKLLMEGGSVQSGKEFIDQQMQLLLDGKVPLNDLAIWQKITKPNYENPPPHIQLSMKCEERGKRFVSGQSIPYVIIDIGDLDNERPKAQKIEELSWAIEHKLRIDILFYTLVYIKHVIETIMDPVMERKDDLVQTYIRKAFQQMARMAIDFSAPQSSIIGGKASGGQHHYM